jgi:hypothetical protein
MCSIALWTCSRRAAPWQGCRLENPRTPFLTGRRLTRARVTRRKMRPKRPQAEGYNLPVPVDPGPNRVSPLVKYSAPAAAVLFQRIIESLSCQGAEVFELVISKHHSAMPWASFRASRVRLTWAAPQLVVAPNCWNAGSFQAVRDVA